MKHLLLVTTILCFLLTSCVREGLNEGATIPDSFEIESSQEVGSWSRVFVLRSKETNARFIMAEHYRGGVSILEFKKHD